VLKRMLGIFYDEFGENYMHILVISPTKGAKLKSDAQAVPRAGDSIYHKGCRLEVKEVIWWPTKDVLIEFDVTWCGHHVSELIGAAAVEAMVMTA